MTRQRRRTERFYRFYFIFTYIFPSAERTHTSSFGSKILPENFSRPVHGASAARAVVKTIRAGRSRRIRQTRLIRFCSTRARQRRRLHRRCHPRRCRHRRRRILSIVCAVIIYVLRGRVYQRDLINAIRPSPTHT